MIKTDLQEYENVTSIISIQNLLIILLAIFFGVIAYIFIMPSVLPELSTSLTGQDPKFFWYLSRGSAIAAFCLLWLSMVIGLLMSNKIARVWFGNAIAYELHQFVSLLGIGFVIFHAMILLGDRYIGFNLVSLFLPFMNTNYRPLWVGLGQISFYFWIIIAFSFYVRSKLGTKIWRGIHYISFALYFFGLIHGIMSGTDTGSLWAAGMYWLSGAVLLFLVTYRVLSSFAKRFIWSTSRESK